MFLDTQGTWEGRERLQPVFCCHQGITLGGWISKKGVSCEGLQLTCLFSWHSQFICSQLIPTGFRDWDSGIFADGKFRRELICDTLGIDS